MLTGVEVGCLYGSHCIGFLHTRRRNKGYARSNQAQYPVSDSNHMSKPFNIKSDIVMLNSV